MLSVTVMMVDDGMVVAAAGGDRERDADNCAYTFRCAHFAEGNNFCYSSDKIYDKATLMCASFFRSSL